MNNPFALAFLLAVGTATAASITWDPNTEADLEGYHIYWGPASRQYTNVLTVRTSPGVRLTNWVPVTSIGFVAVTAFNTNGLESDYSNEITVTNRPAAPKMLRQVVMDTEWLVRTNKGALTPIARIQTLPGASLSATMLSGDWFINRTVVANSNGVAEIVGKVIPGQQMVALNITRLTVPLAVAEGKVLP